MDQSEPKKGPAAAYFGGKRPTTKVTKTYLRQRGKTAVTLTRQELAHMARLLKAGKIMLNDTEPLSKQLRAAMSKLDVDTSGL
jgi:hypothetical protein